MCWPLVTMNVLLYPSALSFSVNHLLVLTSHQTPWNFSWCQNLTRQSFRILMVKSLSYLHHASSSEGFSFLLFVFSELVVVRTFTASLTINSPFPSFLSWRSQQITFMSHKDQQKLAKRKIMCVYIYFFPCVINTILKINYLLLFLPRYSFLPSLFWDWSHSTIESITFQTSPSSDKPTKIDLYLKT